MTAGISAGGYPGLAQALAGLTRTRHRFDTLTQQASSGRIADTYAGLESDAPLALSLAPRIEQLRTAQSNVDAAGIPAQITQIAMKQIQSIAAALVAELPNLNGLDASRVDMAAANARSALVRLAGLLNSQSGDTYVFSGQDAANPAVPEPDQILSSGFFLQISATVGALSTNGAAATAAATLTIASDNTAGTSPFSTWLSQPAASLSRPMVSTGQGEARSMGLLASANVDALSAGGSTTGSYMRDLMRALATVGSMSGSQINDPNFAALVEDTRASMTDATTAMSTDVGILGQRQADLIATQTTLSDTMLVLTAQFSLAKDVDMAVTLSDLTQTQTQLQASYQLIATTSGLSLAKFLPGA